jgi:hypothetical protein
LLFKASILVQVLYFIELAQVVGRRNLVCSEVETMLYRKENPRRSQVANYQPAGSLLAID